MLNSGALLCKVTSFKRPERQRKYRTSLRHFSSSFLHLTALKRKHRLTIVQCWKCINNCFLVFSVFTFPLLLDGHWCWEGEGRNKLPLAPRFLGLHAGQPCDSCCRCHGGCQKLLALSACCPTQLWGCMAGLCHDCLWNTALYGLTEVPSPATTAVHCGHEQLVNHKMSLL